MMHYTSLNLSKKLKENGCNLKGSGYYTRYHWKKTNTILGLAYVKKKNCRLSLDRSITDKDGIEAYDLFWDICVKNKIEFWGDNLMEVPILDFDEIEIDTIEKYSYEIHTENVLALLQNGEELEVEEYILKNCLFTKNKKTYKIIKKQKEN